MTTRRSTDLDARPQTSRLVALKGKTLMKRPLAVFSLLVLASRAGVAAPPPQGPTPVPTLTKEQRQKRLDDLKRTQAAGTDFARPLASLHPEGDVIVTWKRDFPATLNSEALRDSKTMNVPVYGRIEHAFMRAKTAKACTD